ncbi:MAG: beta-phosphoglucomutase [Clostridiales bacterium]|jgi:beta-phosphoglucomutase|nr:beta-phosphoglucomutase [Clostridiales bacterium]
MIKKYKGFVFDLDGVLTETSNAHFEAWRELATEMGFELPGHVIDEVRGISRLESLDIVLSYDHKPKEYSYDEKVALATRKNNLYLDKIKAYSQADLSEGTIELLELLKSNHIRIALASASNNAPFLLDAMKIKHYFDAVVDPKSISNGKPAPDIFLKACEMLDLEPHECVGIEDAEAGIESIKSAGLYPIGIGKLSNCEEVYPDLKSLLSHLL